MKYKILFLCLSLFNCTTTENILFPNVQKMQIKRIEYTNSKKQEKIFEDKNEIKQIIEILARSKRTPSKFIIKERIKLIESDSVIEIGKNGQFLNFRGITYMLSKKQNQKIIKVFDIQAW